MDVTRMAVELFGRRAVEYQQKFMDVSLYADSLDLLCELLPKNAEVLELACGPGNISRYLLEKRPDLLVLATDLAPEMLRLAAQNNPQANVRLLDCRDVSKLEKSFDVIVGGFCLPYLSKEESLQLFTDCAAMVRPQGLLYFSTMEDDHSNSGLQKSANGETLFTYYHESEYLTAALERLGFVVLYEKRKFFKVDEERTNTDLILVAKKK